MVAVLWLLVGAVTAPEVVVQAQLIDGSAVRGQLEVLDNNGLKLRDGKMLRLTDLASVELASPTVAGKERPQPDVWIRCVDGSRTPAHQLTLRNGVMTAQLRDETKFTAAARAIDSVRFYAPAAGTNEQWEALLKRPRSGDVVIVRKSADSLDLLEGVIHEITSETVEFEFDGQRIPVRRSKLEGIAFVVPREPQKRPIATVFDRHGGQWYVSEMQVTPESAKLTTAAGVHLGPRVDSLRKLDFASSNIVLLSDLAPERQEWEPFFPGTPLAAELRQIYQPRQNESFVGEPLQLTMKDGSRRAFARGLAIHSRSRLVYRLPESFERLRATAGIDASMRGLGNVQLTIEGDGKSLWSGTIAGNAEPVELDIPLKNVRRLAIVVDYGENLDIADHLDLCDPRLIKGD